MHASSLRRRLGTPAILLILVTVAAPLVARASSSSSSDPVELVIDPAHSEVGFRVRHLGLSRVTGEFNTFEGRFTFDPDDPAASSVSVTIDAASIDTGVQQRDDHLRSADFLDVAEFPQLTFRSTSVRAVDAEHLEITGDLTIRGITRQVVLATEFLGMAPRRGGQTAAFEATTRINRHDYGLVWNALQEGLQIVGDEVDITLRVEANTPRQRS